MCVHVGQSKVAQQEEELRGELRKVLKPRPHQVEAIDLCLAGNRIINLPTGTGKTLIAVKIIDYFLTIHEAKKVIFVVPTRALVEQQANYITTHSNIRSCAVVQLSGMEVADWDKPTWDMCKKSNKVLVGTAEIFRMSLVDTGFLQVRDISCVVFDECHNVRIPTSACLRVRKTTRTPL